MSRKWFSLSLLIAGLVVGTSIALAQPPNGPHGQGPNQFHLPPQHYPDFYVYCEMMGASESPELGFINTADHERTIQRPLLDLDLEDLWPGTPCQHAWALPDGGTVYLTLDADPEEEIPAKVLVIKVEELDWDTPENSLVWIDKVLSLDEFDSEALVSAFDVDNPPVSYFPDEDNTEFTNPWFSPPNAQGHGPSFLPQSHYTYTTEWPDKWIHVIDTRTDELVDTLGFEGLSQHTHGVNFNHSGTVGLGSGYYYDLDTIDVYEPNKQTGELVHVGEIPLEDETGHAAFTHYTFWLNNRYALTATMQVWPTLEGTRKDLPLIGPSVWLLDVRQQTAEKIIDPVPRDPNAPREIDETGFGSKQAALERADGIFRPASDLVVAKHKIYVAEEDSLEGVSPTSEEADGYVSIFDISDIHDPKFEKRLTPDPNHDNINDYQDSLPSDYLPPNFAIAHGAGPTADEDFVYVASYASGYIIVIDTESDQVVAIFNEDEEVIMPHGGFFPGSASDSSFAHPPRK